VVAGGGTANVAGGAAGAPAGAGRGGRGNATPTGPNQCHDITVYPDVGLAGGACAGLGLLLDIREATHPIRIDFVGDANMSFWHSATFSNDGKKILFTDEWGGGSAPRCRATDKLEWGADALFAIENNKMVFKSYYKMPAAQTDQENCVAHNGSNIPIPGREVMVQAFYQGGLTIFDWTDPAKPFEVAFHDRGPVAADRLISGGSWSAYWYNGIIVSSEIARGLDIFELVANPLITQNEIDAAKTVKMDYWNTQEQRRFVWPPSFAKARAFVDQLERSKGLSASRIVTVRTAIDNAEKEVRIINPYFVPHEDLRRALRDAARRGVEVTLILPAHSDSWITFYAGRSYYGELLDAGVKIYERRDRILHAKSATVDGVWTTIGSTNLDWRSLLYNDEINIVVMGPEFAGTMNGVLERAQGNSDLITRESWAKRPLDARAKEAAAKVAARWL